LVIVELLELVPMPNLSRAVAVLWCGVLLTACVGNQGPAEPYPFVGTWDCEVETFIFTETTYNNGSQTLPIRTVTRDGRNYTLFFPGNYVIALAAVTDTGMTWVSGKTGDQFSCRRVK
jgi:hypothetical protein